MKEIFKKISAILLAIVVLFTTMSYTVHEHYCGGELIDSSLFSKATSCEMDNMVKMNMPISDKSCSMEEMEDCCDDIVTFIEGQSELKINVLSLDFEQQLFITAFAYSYINLFEGLDNNVIPFKDYSPPLLIKDIQVLDEVFLI